MTWAQRQRGQGPRLLMLHGWGMESRVFDPWVRHLAKDFRCECADLPGHGQSPAQGGMHWSALQEDLAAWIRNGEKPILLGWSLGALLALGQALQGPEQLRGLVLVAGSAYFVQEQQWDGGIPRRQLADFATQLQADPGGTRRRFLALQVLQDPQGRQALAAMDQWPLPDQQCLADGLEILTTTDLRKQVRPLPIPVLLIHGRSDRIVPPAASAWLQEHLATPHLALLSSGHAPFLGQPERCSQRLREVFHVD